MYSAPDKLPKRFSIIQNVCDFTRLSLEMSNSLSISGQCSGEQMFSIPLLLGVCIAVRERAPHLVIKIWVLCTGRIELWTPCWHRYELMLISTSPDLSGGETNDTICMCSYFYLFFYSCVCNVNQKYLRPGGYYMRNVHFQFSSQMHFIVLYRVCFPQESSDFWLANSPEPAGWLSLTITNEETGCRWLLNMAL